MDLPETIRTSPCVLADAYKLAHHKQYPPNTCWVYSNWTARYGKYSPTGGEGVIFFGLQAFLYQLNEHFDKNFFNVARFEAINEFKAFYHEFFGTDDELLYERVAALHDLGYLPLRVKALPEGAFVPYGVPMLTICNTDPRFFWLTNFVESWMSAALWHPCTSATTANAYRKRFDYYADLTGASKDFVSFQGHDFSFRGMEGIGAACASGAGHLLSFLGTDSLPAIDWIKRYYGPVPEMIGTSVPATEHSVVCAGGEDGERETLRRLLVDVYPSGIFSSVSDTWDFWALVTDILPSLKKEIMARDGKLVIRPDSGDPFKIICGDKDAPFGCPEYYGLVHLLWVTFGGTTNAAGFRELDSHIGVIYGDSITYELQGRILEGLKVNGYASSNVVLGVGSYTYQLVSRDSHGFAMKATAVGFGDSLEAMEVHPIFKTPKTDSGGKNSAKGLLCVVLDDDNRFALEQDVTRDEERLGCLITVYEDGALLNRQTFDCIRYMASGQL